MSAIKRKKTRERERERERESVEEGDTRWSGGQSDQIGQIFAYLAIDNCK
jgi:hypothetical protein